MSAIFYFLVLVGVLVFVHEFGHYIVARAFRVKVLSFSIGFGPRAFGFKYNDEDWVVRWLPLGGYVQMLGSDPMEDTPPEFKDVSFQYKPLWQRALIILAGPLFNLILPIPIFFFVMLATHGQEMPPVVGQVLADSPADGKLERGDEIVAIDGDDIQYWYELVDDISSSPGEAKKLTVLRDGERVDVDITPAARELRDELGLTNRTIGRIGIVPSQYRAFIGVVDPQGPAAQAGLQTFDEVLTVNGDHVPTYVALEQRLRREDKPVTLVVLRERPVEVPYGHVAVQDPMVMTLAPRPPPPGVSTRGLSARWGLDSAELFIVQVTEDSPASRAGLQRGDQVIEVDGRRFNNFVSLMEQLRKNWEQTQTLTILRDGARQTLDIELERVTVIGEFKEERPVIMAGFYHLSRRVPPPLRDLSAGDRFAYAAEKSIETTVMASGLLVLALFRMAEGELSKKSLGGPIMIGQMASKAGDAGIEFFLQMMAYISINLGIINLLPIPVLDGGHLLLFAMEAIKRGPLSLRTRQIASYVGLSIVIFLMLFAFKNDLERNWSDIVSWFGG